MGELHTCKGCTASTNSVFRNLTPSETSFLEAEKHCSVYKKGEILYREGNRISGVYCIIEGILKIYKTGSDGKEQIVAFAKKGDLTGYRSVLSNEPACTTAEVLEETNICFIPSAVIFQLVRSNGDFSLSLLQLTCRELDQANSIIKDIAQKTVRERLAEALLMLHSTFGVSADGNLNIILTREELANIVGTATESVIRLLSDFKSEGLIALSGKKIRLENIKKLEKLSKSFF
jgi:CRP/FNR family transcriptional regulator, polysaccharide utilization system transcription regulator